MKKVNTKTVLGVVLMAVGVGLGLWVGVWWAFIGGIVDVIREVRAPELNSLSVAVGVAKILLAGFLGWVSAAAAFLPGYALFIKGTAQSDSWQLKVKF